MLIQPDAFSIINIKAQDRIIYITTDTTWNVMTYTFINNTGSPLQLTGGEPVNGHVPGGASSLVIDFASILKKDEVSNLGITDADGKWKAVFFPSSGPGSPNAWALAPINTITLAVNEKVVFTITKLACTGQAPGNFEVKYFNINGYDDLKFAWTYHMSVIAPPVGNILPLDFGYYNVVHPIGPQTVALDVDLSDLSGPVVPIEVDITYNNNYPIKNGYTLYLKNTSKKPLEPNGTPLGAAAVYISFVFASGDPDAITSQALGDTINININPEKSSWFPNLHEAGTGNWQFSPLSTEVMFENETVSFDVSNIITEQLTTANTLSTVYIQINNIPGYQDAVYTLQMLKKTAVAKIPVFTANPTTIGYNTPYTNTGLTWTTEVAYKVTLEYQDKDGGDHFFDSTQGQISLDMVNFQPNPAPSAQDTKFTLKAYDNTLNVLSQVDITVNEPPATIDTFTSSSYLVNILAGNQVTITWATSNAQEVKLQGEVMTDKSGSKGFTINNTMVFTMEAKSYAIPAQTVTKTFTVFAYKAYPPVPTGAGGDGTVWQSLPLTLLNSANNHIYVTNAVNGGNVYQVRESDRVVVSPTFAGNIMALSPDKSLLFIAEVNTGSSSGLISYNTASGVRIDAIGFPGPPPYCMGVSPDQKLVFAAQQNNCTAVSVFNITTPNGNLSYNKDITVGNSPRNIVFLNGSAYIPNYRDGNVSVIDLTSLTVTATIALNQGEPRAMAVKDSKIYVACERDNIVVVIDTANGNSVTPITCDWRPFHLEFNQNKSLLFCSNFASNTVSVIDTTSNAVTNLTVGSSPSASRVSNSGKLLFVSNYCDNTLSVIDLSNNQQKVVQGSIALDANSGNPVDITPYNTDNYYTDLFIAKENFKNRTTCANPLPNPANLQMSVFSIQELGGPQTSQQDTSMATPQASN